MDNNDTRFLVITGSDPSPRDAVKDAVAKRFETIKATLVERPGIDHPDWTQRHIYNDNRCQPQNLGWRFERDFGAPDPKEILEGKWDAQIEATWHEAANSEYWYAYEKDWGSFDVS